MEKASGSKGGSREARWEAGAVALVMAAAAEGAGSRFIRIFGQAELPTPAEVLTIDTPDNLNVNDYLCFCERRLSPSSGAVAFLPRDSQGWWVRWIQSPDEEDGDSASVRNWQRVLNLSQPRLNYLWNGGEVGVGG